MKKSILLSILTISIIILLSVNIISASWVSDTWQKITGDAVSNSNCPTGIWGGIKKAINYDLAGQKLLDKGIYRGIPIVLKDKIIGSTGKEISARMRDTDPNGCTKEYGNPKNKRCINPTIEISKNKLKSNYDAKSWTNPRTLSDGSKATALPANFFRGYGEDIRDTLEHEYQHTKINKVSSEKIGQYEDRVEKKANEVLMKVRAQYDKNCKYI